MMVGLGTVLTTLGMLLVRSAANPQINFPGAVNTGSSVSIDQGSLMGRKQEKFIVLGPCKSARFIPLICCFLSFQPLVASRSGIGGVLPSAEPCPCDGSSSLCGDSSFCGEDIANYPVDEINVSFPISNMLQLRLGAQPGFISFSEDLRGHGGPEGVGRDL